MADGRRSHLRAWAAGVLAAGGILAAGGVVASAAAGGVLPGEVRWMGTWAAAPQPPLPRRPQVFDRQTVRLFVHSSAAGGGLARIRISNLFGDSPLVIGAARLALRATTSTGTAGATAPATGTATAISSATTAAPRDATTKDAVIDPAADRRVTFSGAATVTIAAGAVATSDAVDLAVPALADLAVSLYFPQRTVVTTTHVLALQSSFVGPAAGGDQTGAANLAGAAAIHSWPFLSGIDVPVGESFGAGGGGGVVRGGGAGGGNAAAVAGGGSAGAGGGGGSAGGGGESGGGSSGDGCIVAFGDSTIDGDGSTVDANRRWTDVLASRLQAAGGAAARLGVLNEGLIGNRLLFGSPRQSAAEFGEALGPAGLDRFERDVLDQAGVRFVIVRIGTNDIGFPGSLAARSERPNVQRLIDGYRRLIALGHSRGLRVYGTTLGPFQGAQLGDGYYTAAKEAVRQKVNAWMRGTGGNGAFDAVIDFDAVLRDPRRPTRLRPELDSGDHLHPNDAGYRAAGEAIPLELFRDGG